MKVTISDVARLAGVSTATVSHTINSTRYVSGDTKEKVYQAIRQLGYTPDASARSFRTGKKRTIGFIVPDISNKFFGTIIESAENHLSAKGYHLIIANTKENMDREETNLRLLTAGLVDGLLIASTMDDFARLDGLIPAGFPVVLVDRTFESQKYSSVSVSNFQPIYRSVCRLAAQGKRRIGVIGGLRRLSTTQERIAACRTAMADCGLPQDEDLILYGDSMEDSAPPCLERLLERGCDAILVCQGLMASVTIAYLRGKGIQPRRLARLRQQLAGGEGAGDQGFALWNINDQLKTYYGEGYGLWLESVEDSFTSVRITMPIREADQNVQAVDCGG